MQEMTPEPALAEVPEPPTPAPGRVRRFFRTLFKWLIIVAVIAGVGAGVYFGWPVVRERVVDPLEANTAEVTELRDRVIDLAAEVAALEGQLAFVSDDVATGAAEASEARDVIAADVSEVRNLIAANTRRLDELAELQAALDAGTGEAVGIVERQLVILRSMDLLSRARLFLFEANYGLAIQDVEAARNLLASVEPTEADEAIITETLFRLDRTLGNLPLRPVVASNDLDIAWAVLLGEIPPAPATPPTTEPAEETTTTTSP